jgi:hypothetical protein
VYAAGAGELEHRSLDACMVPLVVRTVELRNPQRAVIFDDGLKH